MVHEHHVKTACTPVCTGVMHISGDHSQPAVLRAQPKGTQTSEREKLHLPVFHLRNAAIYIGISYLDEYRCLPHLK